MRNPFDIGIDLGNSKFSLLVRGEGIVASEAAYLAYEGDRLTARSLVAVGDEARRMFERTPPGLHVICPMREGVVVDCGAASLILGSLARRAGIRRTLTKPKALVAALYGSSSIERKAFLDAAAGAGGRGLALVHEPLAAMNSLPVDLGGPSAYMLVDVGDGATEAVIVSSGQTLVGSSIRFGGNVVETRLMDFIRKRLGLAISRTQARSLKERFTDLATLSAGHPTIAVKGINVNGFLPCEKIVPLSYFRPFLDGVADIVATFVREVLALAPPQASVDLIEHGIYLCGGSSRLAGVRERLEECTQLTVKPLQRPEHAVVQGLEQMLSRAALS